MWHLRRFVLRLVAVVRPARAERELGREIAAHLSALEEEFQRRGLSAAEARAAARRAFGGVEQAKEHQRDERGFRWVDDASRDLRYAVRTLCRTPAFTAVAVLTLALGIGANTAIFGLVDVVLLRSLPVSAPERLVVLDAITPRGEQNNISYPLFERLRDGSGVFSGVLAALDGAKHVDMIGPGPASQPEPVQVQPVSGEYFDVLGASPLAGRTLTAADDRHPGAQTVAVLSFDFWKRRFGADSAVIGAEVTIHAQRFTIVGVTRPGFFGEAVGRAPDMWVPLSLQPLFDRGMSLLDRPNVGWLRVIARIRPGISRDQAAAALAVGLARLQGGTTVPGSLPTLASIRLSDGSRGLTEFRERFSLPLRTLAGVVGLVLLIACANVSSLLLARATARQREIAVRLAIGAGRARLIRQFLTESAALAGAGGALGLLFAWWGSRLLLVLASDKAAPIPIDVGFGARTLLFTSLVSCATVFVFGLAPALSASRVDVGASLTLAVAGRRRTTLPALLVVTQVALSLLLLTGAALLVETLRNLRALDLGFAAGGLMQIRIVPESSGYTPQQVPELTRRLVERLTTVPGVQAVTMAHSGFATGTSRTCCIAVEGYTPGPTEDREIRTMGVAAGYFGVLGIHLVLGRDFAPHDAAEPGSAAPAVAIVNGAFARRYYPHANAVGKHFGWGDKPGAAFATEIIGVARDANDGDLRGAPKPLIYVPAANARFLIVRAGPALDGLTATLRREIQTIDRDLEFSIRPVSDEIERALVREKMLAKLSGFFGVLAVSLSALGLYGLMAYAVVSRTREIGIRMAIGARRETVLRAEMLGALRLVTTGIVLGIPVTLAGGRLIASQLFNVSATNPALLALAVVLLVLVSAAAAYLPARRASRVDPIVALRQ